VTCDIPMTVIPWDQQNPGHLELDLPHHCGHSLSGDYVRIVQMIDIAASSLRLREALRRPRSERRAANWRISPARRDGSWLISFALTGESRSARPKSLDRRSVCSSCQWLRDYCASGARGKGCRHRSDVIYSAGLEVETLHATSLQADATPGGTFISGGRLEHREASCRTADDQLLRRE